MHREGTRTENSEIWGLILWIRLAGHESAGGFHFQALRLPPFASFLCFKPLSSPFWPCVDTICPSAHFSVQHGDFCRTMDGLSSLKISLLFVLYFHSAWTWSSPFSHFLHCEANTLIVSHAPLIPTNFYHPTVTDVDCARWDPGWGSLQSAWPWSWIFTLEFLW